MPRSSCGVTAACMAAVLMATGAGCAAVAAGPTSDAASAGRARLEEQYEDVLRKLEIRPVPGIETVAERDDIPVRREYEHGLERDVIIVGRDISLTLAAEDGRILMFSRDALGLELLDADKVETRKPTKTHAEVAEEAARLIGRLGIDFKNLRSSRDTDSFKPLWGVWNLYWAETWNGVRFIGAGVYAHFHEEHGIVWFIVERGDDFVPPVKETIDEAAGRKNAVKYAKLFVETNKAAFAGYRVDMDCKLRQLVVSTNDSTNDMAASGDVFRTHEAPDSRQGRRLAWVGLFEVRMEMTTPTLMVIYVDAETGLWIGGLSPVAGASMDSH